ncbi:uncharacterized protein MELLADRAFT_56596 [Melampsora larici-populina 98AG31]|uniref:Uncharacterized protein n=1 Tax=Melampsora larici-populina (strain 98AG31 / pathotype 3-4-7) TaxID=747676 RepID=F4RSB6_MELLP|nr:uncharacterized protein MELLADRAFT_56596 [Melampsora larici-populina 98AG31]EGG04568.1 hypothetical protein MELLADRAFT_56596 [Melampsora larici-populina 98AG31]
MRNSPKSSPKPSQNGNRRPRQTKAQIAADLALSGHVVGSRPTPAAVKRSRLAAKKRAEKEASVTSIKRSTSDSPPFDLVDYKTILAYLAKPNVLNSLFGGGSQTKVTGLPMSPKTLLNTLAIKLNNNYNERYNSTDMHLTGRTLLLRLRRYKGKYQSAKSLSLKTGAGLEPKHHARGIHSMEALLESMCPCYPEMDALFRDKGNVNPFGILDSGLGSQDGDDSAMDSDGDLTDGLDPGPDVQSALDRADRKKYVPLSPTPEAPSLERTLGTPEALNNHYRSFLDLENDINSLPPTPKGQNDPKDNIPSPVLQPIHSSADIGHVVTSTSHAKPSGKRAKRAGKYDLTAEERALDSSSEDEPDALPVTKTQATARSANRTVRAPLSRRGLDPLPSIDPSNVHVKDHKNALASAIQQANDAKMEVFAKAQQSREQIDQARIKVDKAHIQADLEDRKSTLSWTKERYFLDREEQREMDSKRLAQETRKERKAFCERLVLEGKTPQELEAYL